VLHQREVLLGSIGGTIAALGAGARAAAPAPDAMYALLKQAIGTREQSAGMIAVTVSDDGTSIASYGSSGVAGVALDGRAVFEIMSITRS